MASVLVAPDSFKGTFSAVEVAEAIGRGLSAAGLDADLCPVADGGEGTMETLLASIGGDVVEVSDVRGPLGGSATVDGGRGALEALDELGGAGDARIVVLCDVQTPWERCAEIYGPQKGADPPMVARLAGRLDTLAAELPRDPRGVAMTGAAGGLSGGLWAGLDAALEPGAPYVLDAVRFDARLRDALGVIAGEGRIDEQSVMGKIVGEIGERALRAGVPLHAIVGRDSVPSEAAERIALRSVREATTLEEIEAAAQRLGGELAAA